jgi:hypothetical protein
MATDDLTARLTVLWQRARAALRRAETQRDQALAERDAWRRRALAAEAQMIRGASADVIVCEELRFGTVVAAVCVCPECGADSDTADTIEHFDGCRTGARIAMGTLYAPHP